MYCDNGTSVTKDILEYVLQPLKKLSDGHNDLSSAGLGFSIMSRIAELLSGSLTITATPTGLERESYWSDIEDATGLQVILSIPVEPQQTHIELE
jgi:signal transduction histidine kinase